MVACLVGVTGLLGLPIFFASWASSVALMLTAWESSAAAPHRIGLCHVAAALIGLVAHAALPTSAWSIGASVAVAACVVLLIDLMHPPAMANAAFAFVGMATPLDFILTAAIGGLLLGLFALASSQIRLGWKIGAQPQ